MPSRFEIRHQGRTLFRATAAITWLRDAGGHYWPCGMTLRLDHEQVPRATPVGALLPPAARERLRLTAAKEPTGLEISLDTPASWLAVPGQRDGRPTLGLVSADDPFDPPLDVDLTPAWGLITQRQRDLLIERQIAFDGSPS